MAWSLVGNLGSIAAITHAATGKSTPDDDDELAITDSETSYGLKKLTWANLKQALDAVMRTSEPDQVYGTDDDGAPTTYELNTYPSGWSVVQRYGSGELRLAAIATASRPAISGRKGLIIFDSTLNKPIYSDGANWRSFADDTIV